jgi:hypothetical protein
MIALKPTVGCVSGSAVRLSSVTPSASNARRKKGVLLARHHADEATEPNPGVERVGAGERRAEQRQETIEEAVVLDEIARHHRIGHASGEQLVDEAMPHGIRPGRLARSAQYFGEAFRQRWSPLIRPLTGFYAPAVPAGDTSKRSAQAYGT